MPKRLEKKKIAPAYLQLKMTAKLKSRIKKMASDDEKNISEWFRHMVWQEWTRRENIKAVARAERPKRGRGKVKVCLYCNGSGFFGGHGAICPNCGGKPFS